GGLQRRPRAAAPLDADHVVERPVADRDRGERRRQVQRQPLHARDEGAQRNQPRRPRPPGAEPERVRHHPALREAAQHDPLEPDPLLRDEGVQPLGRRRVAREERLRLRRPDPPEHVPVRAAGRQRERPARRGADQPPLRIEGVEQREEVELVRAAPVEEDERPLGRPDGGPEPCAQTHEPIVTVAPCASRGATPSPASPATPPATSTSTSASSDYGSSRSPSTRMTRPSTTSSTPTRTAVPAAT